MLKCIFKLLPLILTTCILSVLAFFYASLYSVHSSWFEGWSNRVLYFPLLFIICFIAIGLIESYFYINDFIDHKSRQINIYELWKATIFKISPLGGILASSLMGVGIIGCANLTEIYRSVTVAWNDNLLWEIEKNLFYFLIGSWIDVPEIWDHIYFSLWVFVIISMVIVYRFCHFKQFIQFAMAVVIAFYLTRCFNLLFPTAGPAFYKEELFNLAGTHCAKVQKYLRLYMDGQVTQNGLMPGTMAMPSLHVGLMVIAVWRLAYIWRTTLWVTVPWFLLVWMSTVMLGWHYVLDGFGGIIVIAIAMFIARTINIVFSFLVPDGWYTDGNRMSSPPRSI